MLEFLKKSAQHAHSPRDERTADTKHDRKPNRETKRRPPPTPPSLTQFLVKQNKKEYRSKETRTQE